LKTLTNRVSHPRLVEALSSCRVDLHRYVHGFGLIREGREHLHRVEELRLADLERQREACAGRGTPYPALVLRAGRRITAFTIGGSLVARLGLRYVPQLTRVNGIEQECVVPQINLVDTQRTADSDQLGPRTDSTILDRCHRDVAEHTLHRALG